MTFCSIVRSRLEGCGTYVSLVSPTDNQTGWAQMTVVVETLGCAYLGNTVQTLALRPEHPHKNLTQWKTNASHLLTIEADVVASASTGVFSLSIAAAAIYTFTTVRFSVSASSIMGQRMPADEGDGVPPATPFPLPYSDSFQDCPVDGSPPFIMDFEGSFTCARDEDAPSPAAKNTMVLKQWVDRQPIKWHYLDMEPLALFSPGYANYLVTAQAKIPPPTLPDQHQARRYISVCCRHDKMFSEWTPLLGGYCFRVNATAWDMIARNRTLGFGFEGQSQAPPIVLAAGKLPAAFVGQDWHELSIECVDSTITASLDAKQLAVANDSTYAAGLAAIGSGWHPALFRKVSVNTTAPATPSGALLGLKQLNTGLLVPAACGWFGMAFRFVGNKSVPVLSLARFRTPNTTQPHNVSLFAAAGGNVMASAVVEPTERTDASGFMWTAPASPSQDLQSGKTYMLASREGYRVSHEETDSYYAAALDGGCSSNSDGHGGGTPWLVNLLGGHTAVLLGSVHAPCGSSKGLDLAPKWQLLHDGPEHAFGPVNVQLKLKTDDELTATPPGVLIGAHYFAGWCD